LFEIATLRPILRHPVLGSAAITKESKMIGMTSSISKLAAAAATAVVLTLGAATPSLAFNSNDGGPFIYQPGSNSAAWSDDNAGAAYAYGPSSYRARAEARGVYRGRAFDDPPGSRFQSRGESRDDMGCPC
jgi:hypothetical protein